MQRSFIIITTAAIIATMAGCGKQSSEQTAEPQVRTTNVSVYTVMPTRFEDFITLPVVVSPYREVDLGASGNGRVTAIHADKGATVRAGAVLLEIEDEILKAQLDQAESNLAYQTKECARSEKLFGDGSITEAALDGSRLALANAKSARAMAQKQFDDATLEAPFDGVITTRHVEVGDIVSPASPAFRLIDMSRVRVQAGIPEKYIEHFTKGGPVAITFDSLPGRTFAGTLTYISPEASPSVRTFLAEVVIPNRDGALKAGIMGNARILKSVVEDALSIPLNALIESQAGRSVFVARDDATAEERPITLGEATDATNVVVSAGITAGDKVIVKGQSDLVTGERINITGETAPAAEENEQ